MGVTFCPMNAHELRSGVKNPEIKGPFIGQNVTLMWFCFYSTLYWWRYWHFRSLTALDRSKLLLRMQALPEINSLLRWCHNFYLWRNNGARRHARQTLWNYILGNCTKTAHMYKDSFIQRFMFICSTFMSGKTMWHWSQRYFKVVMYF